MQEMKQLAVHVQNVKGSCDAKFLSLEAMAQQMFERPCQLPQHGRLNAIARYRRQSSQKVSSGYPIDFVDLFPFFD